ncbi:phage tail assembly protein [Castellaniella sp. S9]|uniref:phage tail assembly protein n=1 Tax=Castellaniella sp. S9 TaxID=2993652 RepID=UPI0022B4F99F|nr:phage tail assembly protein [Castellaniella sp. S9]
MSERTPVSLKYPIEIDGATVSVLHLRRAKVRDRLTAQKMANSDAEREIALIAMLADVAPSDIENLDMADYSALQEALTGFF